LASQVTPKKSSLNKKTETRGAYEQDEQQGEKIKENKNVNSDYLISIYYFHIKSN